MTVVGLSLIDLFNHIAFTATISIDASYPKWYTRQRMTTNPYIGSSLDDLLEEDGILDEVEAIALKQVLAWQVSQAMQEKGHT